MYLCQVKLEPLLVKRELLRRNENGIQFRHFRDENGIQFRHFRWERKCLVHLSVRGKVRVSISVPGKVITYCLALFSTFHMLKFIFLDKFKISKKLGMPNSKTERNRFRCFPIVYYFSVFYSESSVSKIRNIPFLPNRNPNIDTAQPNWGRRRKQRYTLAKILLG